MKTWILILSLGLVACTEKHGITDPFPPDPFPPTFDTDGDTIHDLHEGRFEPGGPTDTDGDTTPDYEDDDSDGDTIADHMEAGDTDMETPPADSDGDGVPDFMDADSDGNGVLDTDEGFEDTDGDGTRDFADGDNDGDGLADTLELSGAPGAPIDTDGDTIPDYNDLDSDNDTISDLHERAEDTDEDGTPDRHDLDTDEDGIPDATEAGDTDMDTPPVDTDGDGIPDFRDFDSDADGLSDRWEFENGLDPYNEDSDGDGYPDLIEVGAGTDPLDASSNPGSEEPYYFIMEYGYDPAPELLSVFFSGATSVADVYFLIDASGSVNDEAAAVATSLRSSIVPALMAVIPDMQLGVGTFTDCAPGTCSPAMANLENVTDDLDAVEAALGSITSWCGTNPPYAQSLYLVATGDVGSFAGWPGVDPPDCSSPYMDGWPCFRPDAMPVIVQIGDKSFASSMSYCTPDLGLPGVVDALNSISARYVGITSGAGRTDMEAIATGTGSTDAAGVPLVFDTSPDGSDTPDVIIDAFETMTSAGPYEISVAMRDDPLDAVDATVFIDHIEPNTVGGIASPWDPVDVCEGGLDVADTTGDTVPDVFTSVHATTPVCFDVYARRNDTVEAGGEHLTFKVFLDLVANGTRVLDTVTVTFMVPSPWEW